MSDDQAALLKRALLHVGLTGHDIRGAHDKFTCSAGRLRQAVRVYSPAEGEVRP